MLCMYIARVVDAHSDGTERTGSSAFRASLRAIHARGLAPGICGARANWNETVTKWKTNNFRSGDQCSAMMRSRNPSKPRRGRPMDSKETRRPRIY